MFSSHDYQYYVYITTNTERSELDIGVTGDLQLRIYQLETGLYRSYLTERIKNDCIYLIYWESFSNSAEALNRVEKIKSYSLRKQKTLVHSINPDWKFLNEEVSDSSASSLF